MFAATTSANGVAIGASNEADGVAFAVWKGGVKIVALEVTTSVIPTRASAYRITAGGTTFSLGFTPTDGEVFMIYNDTAAPVTISAGGVNDTIAVGEGNTYVVFPGGVIRGF